MKNGMRVKHLIKLLKETDPEALVIIAKDSCGNGFRPVDCIELELRYNQGEIGLAKLEPGYTLDDVMEEGQLAVVLWPSDEY